VDGLGFHGPVSENVHSLENKEGRMGKPLALATFLILFLLVATAIAQVKPPDKPRYGGQVTYGALRDIRTTNPFIETYS
jgi:hypothetical protein